MQRIFFRILWSLASRMSVNQKPVIDESTYIYKKKSQSYIRSTFHLILQYCFNYQQFTFCQALWRNVYFSSTIFLSSFLPSNLSITTSKRIARILVSIFADGFTTANWLSKPVKVSLISHLRSVASQSLNCYL